MARDLELLFDIIKTNNKAASSTGEVLVTRTIEVRVEEEGDREQLRVGQGDFEYLSSDVVLWDAGFGWRILIMIYRR